MSKKTKTIVEERIVERSTCFVQSYPVKSLTPYLYYITVFVECKQSKDAGFVYESLQIDTKRTFLTFFSYETNPQNESFENCVTKQIHETNLLKIDWIRKSGSTRFVWIRKSIVLRIREDSSVLANLLKIVSRNESAKRIF